MTRTLALLVALAVLTGCRLEPSAGNAPPSEVRVTEGDARPALPPPAPAPSDPPPSVASPSASAPSGLAVPVAGVGPGDLVDTFEDARSEGRSHDAIDILAPRGTPVVAAADGRVARLFTSDKGGLTVYQVGAVRRDGRWPVYYYAHLDAYAPDLAAGQRLRRGDAVGTVGDTGNAEPGNTHLHFAVWTVADSSAFWDGPALNPYALLTGDGP